MNHRRRERELAMVAVSQSPRGPRGGGLLLASLTIIISFLVLGCLATPPLAATALVSVHKAVVDKPAIVGKPLQYEYVIRNLGNATATRVIIRDGANFAGLSLAKSSGNGTIIKMNVPPQSTTKARLTVTADTERVIPPSRAEVEYTYIDKSTGEEVVRKGFSTASSPVVVYSYNEYRKVFKDFSREWTLFSLGVAIPVLLPLGVWLLLSGSAAAAAVKTKKH